jgi:phosphate transport system substrate-binding protein
VSEYQEERRESRVSETDIVEAGVSIGVPPLVIVLLIVVLLAGIGWFFLRSRTGSSAPAGSAASVPGKVVLRLHGSNTIGAKLAPDLAAAFLKHQGGRDVRTVPGLLADEVSVQAVLADDPALTIIEVFAHGSATAFTDLASGKCDVGMASRRIKPDEVVALATLGDMTSSASEHIVGLDGVAVIVNHSNPLQSLSKQQLAQIFTGEVAQWKQLSGSSGVIKVFRRDDKSGTTDTFKALVLGNKAFVGNAVLIEDSRELSSQVAADSNAIGFVGLPYVASAKAIAVSELGARPLLPTPLTVATEDYPLSRRLYLYTAANSANPLVRQFIDFAIGKSGQEIVASEGFVSQNVSAVSYSAQEGAPAEYYKVTSGAERLSLNFRFALGSSQLDNKALVDLDRVVGFISDHHYTGNEVLLLGFADSIGPQERNLRLSKDRARVVSTQFEQRGLKPAVVTGFGQDLPVASNDSEDGREKNRRVEIWVRRK